MVRTVVSMISAALILTAFFASAEAGANTLNIRIQPHLAANTTLHVDVKPRLYRDVVLVESCNNLPKRNDRGLSARKHCRSDD